MLAVVSVALKKRKICSKCILSLELSKKMFEIYSVVTVSMTTQE